MKKVNFAFTLAETMIVLVVLGVIATLTVPALIQKHTESANRTKIKKAMSVYETALNKMVIENGIKDNKALFEDANSFAPENDCTNTAPYFKVSTVLNNNICTFKAPDGLFWDISKINAPILAFNEADLNNEDAQNRYQLVGHFDNTTGSLRVNDLQYETGDNKTALAKIYDFINNNSSKSEEGAESCDLICKMSKYRGTKCENSNGGPWSCTNCKNCSLVDGWSTSVFDEKGDIIAYISGCGDDGCPDDSMMMLYSKNELSKEEYSWCPMSTKNEGDCGSLQITKYSPENKQEASLENCNVNTKICSRCYGSNCNKYKHTETEQKTGQRWVSTDGSSGSGWCSGSGCGGDGHWEEYTYEVSHTYYK